MTDIVPTFGRCKERERRRDERIDVVEGARARRAEKRFQLRECEFDRIEIWTVWRQKPEVRASSFDGDADFRRSVCAQVVEDHDVAGPQRRHEDLLHVGEKAGTVDGAVEDGRRGQAIKAERGNNGVRFPMPARGVIANPRATNAPPVSTEQIGGDATFVDEHIIPDITEREPVVPAAALSGDVGSSLFVRVDRFF